MGSGAALAGGERRERIAGRYLIHEELGRGGMAVVYRATDTNSQAEVALKQLEIDAGSPRYADVSVLFEREYHMLSQLSHPSIIEVFAYGVDEAGPYYTMELLEGSDLHRLSPLPWRDACVLLFDICSSLALLHSRGIVHRDVSPKNIRCTKGKARGSAKLLDFGAMVPMGTSTTVVGTAPFVAPEVVHRSTLDGRTDLFSFGATLYAALTGRFAYSARKFSDLAAAWSVQPRPPSSFADVPPALDALVLSLLSIDPASRPRSAAEVMERLSAIAGIECKESSGVTQAYLTTPMLVAREQGLSRFRKHLTRSLRGRGGSVLITGGPGVGRSRMLDACALEATIEGATVLRAAATLGNERPFAVAQDLLDQLWDEHPELAVDSIRACGTQVERCLLADANAESRSSQLLPAGERALERQVQLASSEKSPRELQAALRALLLRVADRVRLVLAVDDLHRVDAASAGVLASLAHRARSTRLLLVATADQSAAIAAEVAFELIAEHSTEIPLHPLKRPETQALLASVFGDVPRLGPLADSIHRLSNGNPRECMVLAQHLVTSGAVKYEGGTWRLPERLDPRALPRSIEDALAKCVATLAPLPRRLAECHALSLSIRLEREDYLALVDDHAPQEVSAAIDALLDRRVLALDGSGYVIAHHGWVGALASALTKEQRCARHADLARMAERRGKLMLVTAAHLFEAGMVDGALDRLVAHLESAASLEDLIVGSGTAPERVARMLERALNEACRLQRKRRDVATLQRWVAGVSALSNDRYYAQCAAAWRAQVEVDSGLAAYRALDPSLPKAERLTRALQATAEARERTPEPERGLPVPDGIRSLMHYVGVSIAIGSRTHDDVLLESLPDLLEPFIELSPLVHAMWQNAIATCEAQARVQPERAIARWAGVLAQLETLETTPDVAQFVDIVRKAILLGTASAEVKLGLASARRRLELVADDPLQGVSVLYLRKTLRLMQGDREGAERWRRKAELLAAQTNIRPMFAVTVSVEQSAHALANDLTGVKQTLDRIESQATKHAGWEPYLHLGQGRYQRMRGDLEAACRAFERCIAICMPENAVRPRIGWAWLGATAEYVGTLAQLGRIEEAQRAGARALAICEQFEIGVAAHPVRRALALVEALLGQPEAANQRLLAVIEEQHQLGVTGLNLGASYETGARIAIASGDADAFERYARLTAREYRYGEGSALAVHYEHLIAEARRAGMDATAALGDFTSTASATALGRRTNHSAIVGKAMRSAETAKERAGLALQLLCEAKGAEAGHLFLSTERGLVHSASRNSCALPADAIDQVRAYLNAEIERTDDATVVESVSPSDATLTSALTDSHGNPYRYVPILTEIDGEVVYAGIALIEQGRRTPDQIGVAQLVAVLGQHLIDAGDAHPLRVEG